MKQTENDYHISFFKPTTERARFNRNLVIWLASVWFVAIFGFQILLRVLEKPVPEPALAEFNSAWTSISDGNSSERALQALGKSTLSVLGKVALEPEERATLENALGWAVYKLIPAASASEMTTDIQSLEKLKSTITDIADPAYVAAKKTVSAEVSPLLGLDALDVRTKILPVELKLVTDLAPQALETLTGIMEKYLVHNQSVLTDTLFLGFPFHYFYTAVFLLILFVGLCWLYCVRSDRRNAILGIEE